MSSLTPVTAVDSAGLPVAGKLGLGQLVRHRWLARGVGLAIVSAVLILSIAVPLLSSHSPDDFVGQPYVSPSWSHPFGTDSYGRDVFVRTFAGGRIDLFVAATGVLASLLFGTAIGVAAAAARRRIWETVLMRIVDSIIAFPFVILVLALVLVFGATRSYGPFPAGLPSLLIAIFVWDWAIYARLARAQTLVLRNGDFITAARLLGYSRLRIVRRHLLPHVFRATGAYAVTDAIIILITTAGLPFLGAGMQPPTPEWGAIMYDGRTALAFAWWITVIPGLVLAFTGMGLSLVADSFLSTKPEGSR
jgi:peptide/nickel transport system permease protein